MKKLIIFFIAIGLLVIVGFLVNPSKLFRSANKRGTQPFNEPQVIGRKITKRVDVYYTNLAREKKAFEANDPESPAAYQFAFPLRRSINTTTTTTVQDTIKELLKGPSNKEKSKGFNTEIHNIELDSLVVKNKTATAKFSGDKFYLADDMSGARVRAQLEKTILQFSSIKKVIIIINGNPNFDNLKG